MDRILVPDECRLVRIRDDIDAGRLWKARDRLQGHLRDSPADQVILDLLGSVWFAMGDLPQAGRHWFLTERDDASAKAAEVAFYERYGRGAAAVLRGLPRPAEPSAYPDPVRNRLQTLAFVAGDQVIRWRMVLVPAESARFPPWEDDPDWAEYRPSIWPRIAGAIFCVGVLALIVIGFVTVFGWIVDLVT